MTWHKRLRSALIGLLVGTASLTLGAQIGSVPHVFVSGTTVLSADVNTNFSTVYANALNRAGGTMTGALNTLIVKPVTDAVSDLGTSGLRYRNLFLTGAMTGASATLSGAITGASAALTGAVTAATLVTTGNVTVGTTLTANGSTGTNGYFLQSTGTGAQWALQSPTAYTASVAAVTNTTTETTVCQFTVPSMANGDILVIDLEASENDNSIASTTRLYYGSVSATLNTSAGLGGGTAPAAIQLRLMRVGSDLWVLPNSTSRIPFIGNVAPVLTSPVFGSSQTVAITIQFASASPSAQYTPAIARVYHFK